MDFLKKNIVAIVIISLIALILFSRSNRKVVEQFQDESPSDNIDDFKVDRLKCSAQCCASSWPTGITDRRPEGSPEVIATSMRCSNGVETGCPCITRKQHNFLSHRGGNFPLEYDTEIPESFIIHPENKKLLHKGKEIAYVSNNGMLYGLPNHGAIFDASSLLK